MKLDKYLIFFSKASEQVSKRYGLPRSIQPQEWGVLSLIIRGSFSPTRAAKLTGYSIPGINRCVHFLRSFGFIEPSGYTATISGMEALSALKRNLLNRRFRR